MVALPIVESKDKGDAMAPSCIPSSPVIWNSQVSIHIILVLAFDLVSKHCAYNVNLDLDY